MFIRESSFSKLRKIEQVIPQRINVYNSAKEQVKKAGDLKDGDLKDRWVFHTNADETVTRMICKTNLRAKNCQPCSSGGYCSDPGWFGDHTKGVYVSKHADYTFFYQRMGTAVKDGDQGMVIMFRMFTGKRYHFQAKSVKVQPTVGYHCHESPKHLEYYVFDANQIMPCYLIHWLAIHNKRAILEDQ